MDFDKIILKRKERFLLFALRFTNRMPITFCQSAIKTLDRYGLISHKHSTQQDELGNFVPNGTCRISDKGIRYRIYVHRERFHRFLTPIVVAAITSTVLYISQQLLLPELSDWLHGLF